MLCQHFAASSRTGCLLKNTIILFWNVSLDCGKLLVHCVFDFHLPGCETFEQLLKTFRLSRGMLGEIMSAYEFLDSECMRLLNVHLKLANPISGSASLAATRLAPPSFPLLPAESRLPLSLSGRLSLLHRHRDVRVGRRARWREAAQLPGRCHDVVAGDRRDGGD